MKEMKYSVVRRGTSLVLAATLATGMVPTIALAQDGNADGATPVVQADQQQKQYNLEVGKAYTVDVAWSSMAASFLDKTVQLVWDGSSYVIDISSDNIGFFSYFEVDGKRADLVTNDEGKRVFRVAVSDLEQKQCNTFVTMMGKDVGFTLDFDTSTLPVKEADASYESGYKLYYNGAENERVSSSFRDKVKVIPADGVYNVELTANSIAPAGELGDITYDGKAVAKVTNEDGSVTYTLPLPSVDGTYDFNFSYTIVAANITHSFDLQLVLDGGTYSGGSTDPNPGQDDNKVDKSELNDTIAAAKAIQQGTKTDEAYATLQEAIAKAEKAAANDKIPQAGVDAVLGQLKDAIIAFNTSDDKPAEDPSNPDTKADFKLEQGKEYTVPAKLVKADGSDSMAAQYFESNATVVWDGSHYKVRFAVTEAGTQYIKGVSHAGVDATSLGNNQYEVTVDSLTEAIELTFGLSTPVGDMQQSAYLSLDTTSLPTTTGEPIKPQDPSNNQSGNNNSNQNNNSDNNQNTSGDVAEQGFQVGHTYQVPTSWLKHDSSEESMAAKYFGDTALVRPQSDGTFKVSFSATSEGASHIISLAYNGSTLAQSGNQYTVSIPKADSDTVVPISMTIREMEQLGGGAQVADMHLKLSQAKDLGTGQDNVVASSSKTLSQTGDNLAGVAGAAAVAAVVAGGVAVAARRRSASRR